MNVSRVLQATHRIPLIKFIGKRTTPNTIDHTPRTHPASPTSSLPDSFATYRSNAQQHGPLKVTSPRASAASSSSPSSSTAQGAVGSQSGRALGQVDAPEGVYFDRSELPARFGRAKWSAVEIEAVETGGASLF